MQGKNKVLLRYIDAELQQCIAKKQSCLILGPRQVGKTTLVNTMITAVTQRLEYLLQDPTVRIDLEKDPGKIIRQVEALKYTPLVYIDEAQKIPELFDAVQLLIDQHKAYCVLTGSSARKLRRSGANLLPGRIKRFFMDPLLWGELGWIKENTIDPIALANINDNRSFSFLDSLIFGSLPGIIQLPQQERGDVLRAYTEIYLEEEIRAEAVLRKIGAFSRFLELAAVESGTNPNLTKLSNESGVSLPAVKEFYQVLEDTLIIERVEPYLKNARKRILSSSRYYFFDIGVRNALARFPLEHETINTQKGTLFEHAVMLEIIRRVRVLNKNYRVCFWRTSTGAEVDCIIDMGDKVIPIEIKSSKTVVDSELQGLKIFLNDYPKQAQEGYVITMGERKEKLAENITAIPWSEL
ncbi:MAG: ATP-binding protein [Candidatus Kerfeldbacteria bacterium]|nr:ATP-binding protein [Candidatus Kerfeldbacteria bacterium]